MTTPSRDPIVIERVLDASIGDVFAAFGDAESLAIWMAPAPDMGPATVETEFRVGGAFRIVMHGKEGDFAQHGEYLEIEAPRRIVFTWVSEWVPPDERDTTKVTVLLEPASGNRTLLRLVHEDITAFYNDHENGWETIVSKLERALGQGEKS